MKELYLIVVDKKRNVPVYLKSSVEKQDKGYLFSSLMTVVNQVMSEFDKNKSKRIITNRHMIYAREMDDYIIFIMGQGTKERFALNTLEYIRLFLEAFPSNGEELPEAVIAFLDSISNDFFKIFSRDELVPSIYIFSKSEGLKEVTFQGNKLVDSFLTSHFSKIQKPFNHIFYAPINEDIRCIGVVIWKDEIAEVIVFVTDEFNFIDYLSFRHKFVILGFEHLESYGEYWNADPSDVMLSEKVLHELSTKLEKNLTPELLDKVEITDLPLFIEMMQPVLPSIFTYLVEGKPLGIFGTEEVVIQTAYFLSSVTHIYDVGKKFNIDSPSRIMILLTETDREIAKEMGYPILDMTKIDLYPSIKPLRFWIEKIKELSIHDAQQTMYDLTTLFDRLWSSVDNILLKIRQGADPYAVLETEEFDNKLMKKLVGLANPLIYDDGNQIDEKVINW